MLRSQVAMCVDDVPLVNPVCEEIGPFLQKSTLHRGKPRDPAAPQVEAVVQQHPPVGVRSLVERDEVAAEIRQWPCSMGVEAGQDRSQPLHIGTGGLAAKERRLQRVVLIQLAHHDQPVGHPARTSDRITVGGLRQRHHAEIDVVCEPTIEISLGAARGRAGVPGSRNPGRESGPAS